ncbi:unnamed protein product, partial [Rotaria magnacalcarata]
MDVLYALLGVDNHRFNRIVLEKTFTERLNFVLTMSNGDIFSFDDIKLNRFCINILPKINYNIKSLILESISMERILHAADYPNLTELKIFDYNNQLFSRYFTGKKRFSIDPSIEFGKIVYAVQYLTISIFYLVESPFRHIFQQQITDLILVNNSDMNILLLKQYPEDMYEYILKFFENLKLLSVIGIFPRLSLRNLPMTTCSSSTIYKLCVNVTCFEDCLALLDGRLKELTTFIVDIGSIDDDLLIVYNMDNLPNLKCFSLKCYCLTNEYDTKILPLLRRMPNLEELSLDIINEYRTTLINGTQINNEILVLMPRLYKFTFYINTETEPNNLAHHLSSDDIKQTFIKLGYQQVCCILNDFTETVTCHVFSLPPMFDNMEYIGNTFPSIVFSSVRHLAVHDIVPFKHEFFMRIARFFPLIKQLRVINFEPQTLNELNSQNDQLYSIVEYPYLISLTLSNAHIDYVEQFLNETKTRLPRLTKLHVNYNQLTIVTENFTRDITRINCTNVKELSVAESL